MTNAHVSCQWLFDHLSDEKLRIVDASWYLPAQNRNGFEDYKTEHIPGALFWDIDLIAEKESSLPHTMPDATDFKRHMESLGIGNDNMIVIYDGLGIFSAARPWWMLRSFGHEQCAVLDGGLPKWKADGYPLTSDISQIQSSTFTPAYRPNMFCNLQDILNNLDSDQSNVIDARSKGRFEGSQPEPRINCRSGHIPGSLNVPFDQMLDPNSGTILEASSLQQKFKEAGVDLEKPMITSCGSGVTACVLALALHVLGKNDISVYDGSWSEWGSSSETPVAVG
jgi:thiosulfate/3-mercaptopyruvate sulfurtransferase